MGASRQWVPQTHALPYEPPVLALLAPAFSVAETLRSRRLRCPLRRRGTCMRGFCSCDMGWFGAPPPRTFPATPLHWSSPPMRPSPLLPQPRTRSSQPSRQLQEMTSCACRPPAPAGVDCAVDLAKSAHVGALSNLSFPDPIRLSDPPETRSEDNAFVMCARLPCARFRLSPLSCPFLLGQARGCGVRRARTLLPAAAESKCRSGHAGGASLP